MAEHAVLVTFAFHAPDLSLVFALERPEKWGPACYDNATR